MRAKAQRHWTIRHYPQLGVFILNLPQKVIFLTVPTWPSKAAAWVRGLFPACYARGLRCCDNYGRVMQWYRVFTWNKWQANRLMDDDAGDGPDVWNKISLWQYLNFNRLKRGES